MNELSNKHILIASRYLDVAVSNNPELESRAWKSLLIQAIELEITNPNNSDEVRAKFRECWDLVHDK